MSTEVAAPLAPLAPVAEEEAPIVEEQPTTAVDATEDEATTEEVAPSVSEETTPAGEPSASMEKAEVSTEEAPGAEGEVTAEVADSKKRSAEDADVVADDEEMDGIPPKKRPSLDPATVPGANEQEDMDLVAEVAAVEEKTIETAEEAAASAAEAPTVDAQ